MTIKFLSIKYKNFLSSGNKFIELNLDKHNNTLITGKNGEGKSTFLDAITFTLYNKPFRKINKPQLINNINKSDLLTEVIFEVNNITYKIIRGMKPNIFEIYENNKLVNQDASNRDYQSYLEQNILKMNYKAFTQIVVIGHATYMPFMQLSPNDRRIIIENLLDIDIFSKMNFILKQKILATKEELNDVIYRYDLCKEKLKLLEDSLSNSKTNRENKIKEITNDLLDKENKLSLKKDNLLSLYSEILDIDILRKSVKELQEKEKKLSEYSITFRNKIKSSEKDINFFQENDVCSTCHQDIEYEFKTSYLEKKQTELNKFNTAFVKCENQLLEIRNDILDIKKNIEQTNENNAEITKRKVEISFLEKEIDRMRREILSLQEEIDSDFSSTEAQYNSVRMEFDILTQQRESILNQQHVQSLASVLLKDDGIKSKIIANYLPNINLLINKYLELLGFYINFHLDENFEEHLHMANRENFSYNSFSEGQKKRIDLAILFTWREIARLKNSANTNLLVLDEIADSSLDSSGIDDFLKIVGTMGSGTNVFIISHKDEILERFNNTIRFEMVNGFSRKVLGE